MTTELTQRQRDVLKAITESIRTRGYPPSVREIGEVTGLWSVSSVRHHLLSLEAKGYIRRPYDRARAITVIREST